MTRAGMLWISVLSVVCLWNSAAAGPLELRCANVEEGKKVVIPSTATNLQDACQLEVMATPTQAGELQLLFGISALTNFVTREDIFAPPYKRIPKVFALLNATQSFTAADVGMARSLTVADIPLAPLRDYLTGQCGNIYLLAALDNGAEFVAETSAGAILECPTETGVDLVPVVSSPLQSLETRDHGYGTFIVLGPSVNTIPVQIRVSNVGTASLSARTDPDTLKVWVYLGQTNGMTPQNSNSTTWTIPQDWDNQKMHLPQAGDQMLSSGNMFGLEVTGSPAIDVGGSVTLALTELDIPSGLCGDALLIVNVDPIGEIRDGNVSNNVVGFPITRDCMSPDMMSRCSLYRSLNNPGRSLVTLNHHELAGSPSSMIEYDSLGGGIGMLDSMYLPTDDRVNVMRSVLMSHAVNAEVERLKEMGSCLSAEMMGEAMKWNESIIGRLADSLANIRLPLSTIATESDWEDKQVDMAALIVETVGQLLQQPGSLRTILSSVIHSNAGMGGREHGGDGGWGSDDGSHWGGGDHGWSGDNGWGNSHWGGSHGPSYNPWDNNWGGNHWSSHNGWGSSWGNSHDNSWGNGHNGWGNSWGNSHGGNSWNSHNGWGNSWGNSHNDNSWGNNHGGNSWGNSHGGNSWGNSHGGNSWNSHHGSGDYSGDYSFGDYDSDSYRSSFDGSFSSFDDSYSSGEYSSYSSGDYSSGDYSSGDYSSGEYSSYSSGDYSSGDYSSFSEFPSSGPNGDMPASSGPEFFPTGGPGRVSTEPAPAPLTVNRRKKRGFDFEGALQEARDRLEQAAAAIGKAWSTKEGQFPTMPSMPNYPSMPNFPSMPSIGPWNNHGGGHPTMPTFPTTRRADPWHGNWGTAPPGAMNDDWTGGMHRPMPGQNGGGIHHGGMHGGMGSGIHHGGMGSGMSGGMHGGMGSGMHGGMGGGPWNHGPGRMALPLMRLHGFFASVGYSVMAGRYQDIRLPGCLSEDLSDNFRRFVKALIWGGDIQEIPGYESVEAAFVDNLKRVIAEISRITSSNSEIVWFGDSYPKSFVDAMESWGEDQNIDPSRPLPAGIVDSGLNAVIKAASNVTFREWEYDRDVKNRTARLLGKVATALRDINREQVLDKLEAAARDLHRELVTEEVVTGEPGQGPPEDAMCRRVVEKSLMKDDAEMGPLMVQRDGDIFAVDRSRLTNECVWKKVVVCDCSYSESHAYA